MRKVGLFEAKQKLSELALGGSETTSYMGRERSVRQNWLILR
jgi:hypothetical protein